MAGGDVSGPRHHPAGRGAVADYLAEVAAKLTGPAAARVALAGRALRRCLATRAAVT
jgi:hypothetical protein